MKKTVCLLLVLLLSLSCCACGDAFAPIAGSAKEDVDYYYGSSYAAEDAFYEPSADWTYDSAEMGGTNGFSAVAEPTAARGEDAPAERPGKIIYSADVQVETTDFDASLTKLDELVQEYGGWVESSSVNGSNYNDRSRGNVSRRSANYTLRFPYDRFDALMNSLSSLGNVPYTHTYTQNVTAQYYDVQARLTAYTAQEQRLLEMMEIAETVEDIIILEDRLTEIRYQIESLQSTLNNWDRQVSYSTVYLDLTEVQEYTPEPYVQPSFGQRLLSALEDGWEGVSNFLEDLLFFLAEALPTLLLLAVISVPVVLLARLGAKKRKAKKDAQTGTKQG